MIQQKQKELTSKTDGLGKNCLRWNTANDDLIMIIYFTDKRTSIHAFVAHCDVNYVVTCNAPTCMLMH